MPSKDRRSTGGKSRGTQKEGPPKALDPSIPSGDREVRVDFSATPREAPPKAWAGRKPPGGNRPGKSEKSDAAKKGD